MPVRCTEDQDLVGEKDERGKALSPNAHSRISHLSTSTGTYERVNVNVERCEMRECVVNVLLECLR